MNILIDAYLASEGLEIDLSLFKKFAGAAAGVDLSKVEPPKFSPVASPIPPVSLTPRDPSFQALDSWLGTAGSIDELIKSMGLSSALLAPGVQVQWPPSNKTLPVKAEESKSAYQASMGSLASPWTILYVYPMGEKPFVYKGSFIFCMNLFNDLKVPAICSYTKYERRRRSYGVALNLVAKGV